MTPAAATGGAGPAFAYCRSGNRSAVLWALTQAGERPAGEILRIAADGWVAFARGERDQGLALLRETSEREARTDKHPVTPGPLAPAREQLAEMLLLVGRPAEAQREFDLTPTAHNGMRLAAALLDAGQTEQAVAQYVELDRNRSGLQITFVMIFAIAALLVLMGAVLIGLGARLALSEIG